MCLSVLHRGGAGIHPTMLWDAGASIPQCNGARGASVPQCNWEGLHPGRRGASGCIHPVGGSPLRMDAPLSMNALLRMDVPPHDGYTPPSH